MRGSAAAVGGKEKEDAAVERLGAAFFGKGDRELRLIAWYR